MWTFVMVVAVVTQSFDLTGTIAYTGFESRTACEAFAVGMSASATRNPEIEATFWECTEEVPA